jgi:hypothetical protein
MFTRTYASKTTYICYREPTATCFGFELSHHQAVNFLQDVMYNNASNIIQDWDLETPESSIHKCQE